MLMEATTKCSTVTSVDIKLVTLTLTPVFGLPRGRDGIT